MKHSSACIASTKRIQQAVADYKKQWPNYCRKCLGGGYIISYQSVPYGSGNANMECSDFCSCIEEGKCPRCGMVVFELDDSEFDESSLSCSLCGWHEGEPTCPEHDGDCGCWEIETDEEALKAIGATHWSSEGLA